MDVIEEYACEVQGAISRGLDVPALAESTLYAVEHRIWSPGANDFLHQSYHYFATRRSAQNYFIYKMYETLDSTIKDHCRNWPNHWASNSLIYLGDSLGLQKIVGAKDSNLMQKINAEITSEGSSKTLLNIFLNQNYWILEHWYNDLVAHGVVHQTSQYTLDERIINANLVYGPKPHAKVFYEELARTPVLPVQKELVSKIYFESEEALRVAMLLGANVNVMPGTFFYQVVASPFYAQDDHHRHAFATESVAKLMLLVYQVNQLHTPETLSPWQTAENLAIIPQQSWHVTEDWYRDAVKWIYENSYETFLDWFGNYRKTQEHLGENPKVVKYYVEYDFALTYDVLKSAEKLKVN